MPSIRFSPSQDSSSRSYFGHLPSVPSGFQWPHWDRTDHLECERQYLREKVEKSPAEFWRVELAECESKLQEEAVVPLAFLMQIHLEEIPEQAAGLPPAGILYFFWDVVSEPGGFDPNSRGCCRVIHVDSADKLELARPSVPRPNSHAAQVLEVMEEQRRTPLSFAADWTLPTTPPKELGRKPLDDDYEELRDQLKLGTGRVEHRLLGHPGEIQGSVSWKSQLASNGIDTGDDGFRTAPNLAEVERGVADWTLLLQIDSDPDGLDWDWGDNGRIYFMIRKQDLAAGDFSQVWLVPQSY